IHLKLPHPVAGEVDSVASPMRFSGTPLAFGRAPPLLGQHTDEVLRGLLGKSDAELAQLRADGVV
ncbi:MAG: CoA transferase, partial [Betaproteobacteria bacterium]|nr:CoA transferase [Betaproteobacteria bacterium]